MTDSLCGTSSQCPCTHAHPRQISLGGGMPNPSTFPFTGMSFTVQCGTELTLTDAELGTALQYSSTSGVPVRDGGVFGDIKRQHCTPMTGLVCCVGCMVGVVCLPVYTAPSDQCTTAMWGHTTPPMTDTCLACAHLPLSRRRWSTNSQPCRSDCTNLLDPPPYVSARARKKLLRVRLPCC